MTATHARDDVELRDTELEQDLRTTVRDFLADRCEPGAVAALYDGDRSAVAGLWKGLAGDLGLAGLLVPEEYGGAGASAREAAVVLEELGRSVAPVPFLTSSVIATTTLLAGPTDAGRELLTGLATGERTAALALPLTAAVGDDLTDASVRSPVVSVAGAIEADVLLVPAVAEGGLELRAVPASAVTVTPVVSLDMSRQLADVTVDAPAAADAPVVVGAPAALDAIRQGLMAGTALLAAEQVGVAQWCLAQTVAYLKQRRQFGRIVGGFQALKHRLADLYTSVEGASAAATYAAAVLAAEGPATQEAEIAARVAAAWCGDVAVTAGEEAVQLHGGIGMTWEHPTHLYLKRAKADQLALGLPGAHRARLGDLVDLTV
ncbi:acyl-CoA dehydrogenase family protein [Nocardioides sp. DS6]|uniref:Acyl-CoA dehydrogenase family protein n=1 Tax=Nocardioides eburneus TaxID=3231482 RepID=A0ABV3SYT4_9ACTN